MRQSIRLVGRDPKNINDWSVIFISALLLFCLVLSAGCIQVKINAGSSRTQPSDVNGSDFSAFESRLNTVRQILKIPGMSAAVVQDQELIWASGFGYADVENLIAAGPDTPYGLASVTKPVAAVLIMQLVEQGLINLDDPVSQYGVDAGNDQVTIRHLLTHTSEGNIGTTHNYNGSRYALLGGVIEEASGMSFAELLNEKLLLPLEMKSTALNPINFWGGLGTKPVEDFNLMLGLGAGFKQYPVVYNRLARPYQFDKEYNIIPGMYHLYHNPAAGMISSAEDLARFDIALDQGKLLDKTTQDQMLSPAYSTYRNRQEMMYGLGWYVQEFEGMRLLWHTGCWPPSTSALYLKVPEKNLSFIVLANTDNLTVPFYGIGNGDISQSTLALTFFRYFIYPGLLGTSLPEIDWSGTEQALVQQISMIDERDQRRFLERELWSSRQAFASVGDNEQVDKLLRVSRRSFPRSSFRYNELFTNLPGKYPVIPPTISANTLTKLSLGIVFWFILVTVSIIIMALRILRVENTSLFGKIIWLAATLFLGPIAILVHLLSHPSKGAETDSKWRQALGASVLTITGYTIAWILALTLLINSGTDPHPLMTLGTMYLIPLLVGLFLFRIPLQLNLAETHIRDLIKRNFLPEVITFNLAFAILFSMTWLLSSRLLTTIPHPASPFFWAMLSVIAVIGLLVIIPLHYWMALRGYSVPSDMIADNTRTLSLPTLRTSWPTLLTTLGIMIAALAVTISQIA